MFLKKIIRRFTTPEFILYVISGFIATSVDASTLYCLELWSGWNYLWSAALAFGAGTLTSYILSTKVVFLGYKRLKQTPEILIFVSINIVGLVINQIIISSFSEANLPISKLISIIITTTWNYQTKKRLLFNKPVKQL